MLEQEHEEVDAQIYYIASMLQDDVIEWEDAVRMARQAGYNETHLLQGILQYERDSAEDRYSD